MQARARLVVCVWLSGTFASAPCVAQTRELSAVGVGFAVGGGVSYNAIPTLSPPRVALGPQADFGTLEVRFFLPEGPSIDLYSQLGNTLASLTLAAVPRSADEDGALAFASLGALYNARLPLGVHRWIVGAGLELAGDVGLGGRFERTRPTKLALRIPTRIGIEWRLSQGRIALGTMVRLFYEALSYTRNGPDERLTVGGAGLLELALWFR